MLPIAFYFVQVVLCSGMLMGYYWLVLRNKRFHQYNRFYLLAVALLSWIVPLIKISWSKPVASTDEPGMMYLLSAVASNNSLIEGSITGRNGFWSSNLLVPMLYFAVSAVLLAGMVRAFVRLYRLLRAHSCKHVGDVFLILTQAKGTPFSFFRYIFWNEEIDLRSEAGKQILQHELTHVQQKHSFDKILVQLMLVVGWFNPFLWLLRREMEMIHEFIADKKAVGNGDTAALAQMLLTAAYPQQKFALTHPFFFSPIKRRLQMLTNNQNPRFSYIRRLVVLPLLAIVIVLFAFRSAEKRAEGELSVASLVENYKQEIAEVFLEPTAATEPAFVLLNGKKVAPETITIDELRHAPHQLDIQEEQALTGNAQPDAVQVTGTAEIPEPLFILNGRKMSTRQFTEMNIDPSLIQHIAVTRGVNAVSQYGAEASGGVVAILLKDDTEKLVFAAVNEQPRFSFPVLSGVAEDAYNSIARNRKVYVKEIIYQGEEKTKIIEELHEVITAADGSFSVKLGNGRLLPNSRQPGDVDLSNGPFYVNTKIAVPPGITSKGWVAEDNFVDRGFVQLTLKDNKPLGPSPAPIVWGISQNGGSFTLQPAASKEVKNANTGILTGKAVRLNVEAAQGERPVRIQLKKDETPAPGSDRGTLTSISVANEPSALQPSNQVMGGTFSGVMGSGDLSQPSFVGGNSGWLAYLRHELPSEFLVKQGAPPGKYTVQVRFTVAADGTVSGVSADNDPGYGTKAEAIRVVERSPSWVPAKWKGKPIKMQYSMPVAFVVPSKEDKVLLLKLKVKSAPVSDTIARPVELLLKKLPGTEKDQNGDINVSGQKVKRVIVDGKPVSFGAARS